MEDDFKTSNTLSLGAHTNTLKFRLSSEKGQEILLVESLMILAELLKIPRKLHGNSDTKPLLGHNKKTIFIIPMQNDSNFLLGYIQTEAGFARKFPLLLKKSGLCFE